MPAIMRPEFLDIKLPPEAVAAIVKVGHAADKAGKVFGGLDGAATVGDLADTLTLVRVACWCIIGFCLLVGGAILSRGTK